MRSIRHTFWPLLGTLLLPLSGVLCAAGLNVASSVQVEPGSEILYFLGRPPERLALVKLPKEHGLVAGSKLRAFRSQGLSPIGGQPVSGQAIGSEITTGYLQVETLEADRCLAKVLSDGTELSHAAFAAYPGLMAGDGVEPLTYLVKKVQLALPAITLSFAQLFREPKALPRSYELSDQGAVALESSVEVLRDKRLSRIFIKAYTDKEGPSAQNQVESYQRALAVKHFLTNDLGFDGQRLVAIGMGESAPLQNLRGSTPSPMEDRRLVIEVSQVVD